MRVHDLESRALEAHRDATRGRMRATRATRLSGLLVRRRLLAGHTFGMVARRLGCHRSHPYQWEQGRRLPTAAQLAPLAALYAVPLGELALAWLEALAARHGLRVTLQPSD